MENENVLTHAVIGLAMKVHSQLGPGLLEKLYLECLHFELVEHGYTVEKTKEYFGFLCIHANSNGI